MHKFIPKMLITCKNNAFMQVHMWVACPMRPYATGIPCPSKSKTMNDITRL